MRVVIADSSCLVLFTNISRLDILEQMFSDVWVTTVVGREYGLPLPDWVTVHDPIDSEREQSLALILDLGEASSIALAIETFGSRIIIDEKKGRRVALSLGLDVVGTLGILIEASENGLIGADRHLVDQLDRVGFRLSNRLKNHLIGEE